MNKFTAQPNTGKLLARCIAGTLACSALVLSPLVFAAEKTDSPEQQALAKTGTKYKANAEMQEVLDALDAMHPKPIESLGVAEARKQPTPADAVNVVLQKEGKNPDPGTLVPGVTSKDSQIPGPAGSLPVRVYTPSRPSSGKAFPVIVYFHGGGWVIADKAVYDGGARGLAKQADAIVVSVDYRRAPEARFPAAWDDALAAYKWVAANAATLNGDPNRLALAGESAGGNLAVATAIAVRDDATVQQPAGIIAVYPVAQTGNMQTESYVDSATAKPLNKAMIGWFVDKLITSPADKKDPRLDLIHAELKGLPPVTIINAQIDPLRSDGQMLEAALKKAGVKVDRKVYKGVTHEFFGTAAVVDDALDAQKYAGQQLREWFAVEHTAKN